MAWILHDEGDRAIIAEIEKQSDRGAILVAISFLELRLEQTIKLRLAPDLGPKINGKMFKGYAPLGSFAAKIDMGLWLQLYPLEIHDFLHKLRDLRNDAAHERSAISFTLPTIKDRCENMILILGKVGYAGLTHHMNLMRATQKFPHPAPMKVLHDDGFEATVFSLATGVSTPTKDKFLACIKVVLFHFELVSQVFEQTKIVLPPSHDKSE